MKLSIGMIVRNEEKYLEKCLSALDELRKKVDSELIIVDTGSTDNTIEIAKRFTDKVYNFTWCNDFSAARNEAVKYAKGEWFMGLDADEIFINTDDIIEFFNSGEYQKFTMASFRIRNYSDSKKLQWADSEAVRAVNQSIGFHYEGAIHECFVPDVKNTDLGCCFRLSSIAEHYGYIADDGTIDKKSERNRELLYGEFVKRKDDVYYYMQLFDLEYGSKDYKKAEELAEKCVQLSEYESESANAVAYMLYIKILNVLKKYDKVLEISKLYFGKKRTFEHLSDISVYGNIGMANFSLKNWKEAAEAYENYFELIDRLKNEVSSEIYIHPIEDMEEEGFIIRFLQCAVAYEQTENYTQLSRHLMRVSPKIFDKEFNVDYSRDYVAHAVLLAVQGDDRAAVDYIAENGTQRQIQIMHEIINEMTAEQNPQNEFEQYAAQVKSTIVSMINGGMKEQAYELFEQYKQLCPYDEDIVTIENML